MLLKDFNQIFLSKEAEKLLRELEREPIFFKPGDSRLPAASALERYRLIDLHESPTVTRINNDGRDYLKWLKQTGRDRIIKWVTWGISTTLALLAVIYSYLNYQHDKNADNSGALHNANHGIAVTEQEITNVDPDPFPPVSNSAP